MTIAMAMVIALLVLLAGAKEMGFTPLQGAPSLWIISVSSPVLTLLAYRWSGRDDLQRPGYYALSLVAALVFSICLVVGTVRVLDAFIVYGAAMMLSYWYIIELSRSANAASSAKEHIRER
jgi:hypothetical protein